MMFALVYGLFFIYFILLIVLFYGPTPLLPFLRIWFSSFLNNFLKPSNKQEQNNVK